MVYAIIFAQNSFEKEIEKEFIKADLYVPIYIVETGKWQLAGYNSKILRFKNRREVQLPGGLKTVFTFEPISVGKGDIELVSEYKSKIYTVEVFVPEEEASEEAQRLRRETALYQTARELYKVGIYDEAYSIFQEVYNSNPSGKLASDAKTGMADCLLAQNKYAEAARLYSEIEKDYNLWRSAYCYYATGNYNKAVSAGLRAFKLFPSGKYTPHAMLVAALSLRENKKLTESLALLQKILKKYPKSKVISEVLYRIAETYDKYPDVRNYKLALYYYKRVTVEHPKSRWAKPAQKRIDFIKREFY